MTAMTWSRILGILGMAIFLAYYVHTMMRIGGY
jgi:hypothetical protein